VVHKYASKVNFSNSVFEKVLRMVMQDSMFSSPPRKDQDFAEFIRDGYWKVTLLVVLGNSNWELERDYQQAWEACISTLQSPWAHAFKWYQYLPFPGYLYYRSAAASFRSTVYKALTNNCVEAPEWSVLRLVMEDLGGRGQSNADALEVLMEFFFTGASSVTTSLIWLLYHIAKDPLVQQKLYDEIQATKAQSGKENVGMAQVMDKTLMPHLDNCVRETLRLYTPIHIGRRCIKSVKLETVVVAEGFDVFTNMWLFHRNPDYFENPTAFDPDRWAGKAANVSFFHPFSMGVRGCPGQQMGYSLIKFFAVHFLETFKPSINDAMPEPIFDTNLMLPVTPQGVYLSLQKRTKAD
jgi:cytochrome P450